jgi:DNA polymerase-3 subunit gamma/tau
MIGQSQVTDPLMTALRTNRVNHAYLFSGPRGCGKTTSARILARCLNCAEGPTDTPCGVCPSCVELSRDGSGSLDVVEIDAASHNGVDDARDIRERAIFAPARDRYKIFILDEAHMVTPQGFNALLKIVEEPPEHVKFIFATTEPDKVIGTIRSRTHHYPFRLVPPAPMLEYVQGLCDSEGMKVAPGVLPLVVRAGGGSPRDTLSLLDQLMAGSDDNSVEYERAVALLGYTHASLLDDAVDAIGARDSSAAFDAVDRVIQTGQDPRRFVEDLLERMRDLIIVAATSATAAAAVLRGVPQDELDRMAVQASKFGPAELSRTADILNAALSEMSGATSPRLHLELMIARALIPASDDSNRGALARVERLERRIGVDGGDAPAGAVSNSVSGAVSGAAASSSPAVAAKPADAPVVSESVPTAPVISPPAAAPAVTSLPVAARAAAVRVLPVGPVTIAQIKDSWTEILDEVKTAKLSAWLVILTASVLELRGEDILVLSFPSEGDVTSFKQQQPTNTGVSDYLRAAIIEVLGLRVKFIARADSGVSAVSPTRTTGAAGSTGTATDAAAPRVTAPASGATSTIDAAGSASAAKAADSRQPATPASGVASSTGWATVAIPGADVSDSAASTAISAPAAAAVAHAAPAAAASFSPSSNEPPFDEEPPPFDDDVPPETEPPTDRFVASDDGGTPASSAPSSIPPSSLSPASRPSASIPPVSIPPVARPQGAPVASATVDSAPRPPVTASTSGIASGTAPASASVPIRRPAASAQNAAPAFGEKQRYGESVVREVLGATFLEEQPHNSAPRP